MLSAAGYSGRAVQINGVVVKEQQPGVRPGANVIKLDSVIS